MTDEREVSAEDAAHRWRHAAEEAEKLCFEQMAIAHQAEQAYQESLATQLLQQRTLASQQSELEELRRNLDRSTELIAAFEARLEMVQAELDRAEQVRSRDQQDRLQVQELETRNSLLQRQLTASADEAYTTRAQLDRANERLIVLERQVMQLRSLIERSDVLRHAEAGAGPPALRRHVQLPPFLH